MIDSLVTILDPLEDVYHGFAALLPNLIAMIVIVIAGVAAGAIFRAILRRLLKAVNFDVWSDQTGFTNLLRKCDVWARPSDAAGVFLFWAVILMSCMAGLTALRVPFVNGIIAAIMSYLPRVVSAVVILAVGYIAIGFVAQGLLVFLVNNGSGFARHWVRGVKGLLTMLIVAMALEQLQVAPGIVIAAFSIIFGGSVLALAISFGFAGIDTAKRLLEEQEKKKQEARAEGLQHV